MGCTNPEVDAANRRLQDQVQSLSQEKAELKRKLRATAASLEKAVGQQRKVLGNHVLN